MPYREMELSRFGKLKPSLQQMSWTTATIGERYVRRTLGELSGSCVRHTRENGVQRRDPALEGRSPIACMRAMPVFALWMKDDHR